jgi:mono/diheme cytochrome c family protein
MTRGQRAIGFTATLVIALVLLASIFNEPQRQDETVQAHIHRSVEGVIDIYAYNCVECHGPYGEGFDIYPALNDEIVRQKDALQTYRVIERGRYGTEMAAFGLSEGGMLTHNQINGLVDLILYGDWSVVLQRVAQLDLLPTATPTPTLTPTMTSTATSTPTPTQTPTMPPTFTPTTGPSSTPRSAPILPVMPTGTPESVSPIFGVVPTDIPPISGETPIFDVVPTDIPQGQAPVFGVVATQAGD